MKTVTASVEQALAHKTNSKIKNFLENGKKYLVGKNTESRNALESISFSGVIDDGHKPGEMWNNLPVIKIKDIPENSWVLNCSTSIAPVNVLHNLKKNNVNNIINIHELWEGNESIKIRLPWFVKQQRDDWELNKNKWEKLFHALEDEKSKQTLLDTLRYRITGNPTYMESYNVRLHEQYFESFLRLKKETFIDAGGYDGDSTEIFCKIDPDYKKIFFFEPSEKNLSDAKFRLKTQRDIVWMPVGLSDTSGYLAFDPDAGSASAVQVAGTHTIKVDKLDDCVPDTVTFIKMDLEGWELHALDGCQTHIKNSHPKLAISVYHDASHPWQVFEKIIEWNPAYKVRLRHYTQGWSETVMYFSNN